MSTRCCVRIHNPEHDNDCPVLLYHQHDGYQEFMQSKLGKIPPSIVRPPSPTHLRLRLEFVSGGSLVRPVLGRKPRRSTYSLLHRPPRQS